MTATQTPTRTSRKATSSRPIPEVLLELAYRLHTTKVVAQLPTKDDWRPRKSR